MIKGKQSIRRYLARGKMRRKLEQMLRNLYQLNMQRLKGSSNWANVDVKDHMLQ